MPEKVKIPFASFEYSTDFIRPIVALWLDRAVTVQAMFDALAKWNLDLDEIEGITVGKPSEQGVKIKLVSKRCTIFFGPASFKFTKDDADWSTATETIEILDAALGTLLRSSGAEMVSQRTVFSLHLQPTTKRFFEILEPFLSPALAKLGQSKVNAGASIVKWDSGRIVLDGSGALANGVYVRYERAFGTQIPYEEIARELHSAEEAILKLLDVEVDTV